MCQSRNIVFQRNIAVLPIDPEIGVILRIGIVVAMLRSAKFVASGEHDGTARREQSGQKCAQVGSTARGNVGVISRSFDAIVPADVIAMPIAIVFAISMVMALFVSDEVCEREPVMGRNEIDRARTILPKYV